MESAPPSLQTLLVHLSHDVWIELTSYLDLLDVCKLFSTKSKSLMARLTARHCIQTATVPLYQLATFKNDTMPSYADFRYFLHALPGLQNLTVSAPHFLSDNEEMTLKIRNLLPLKSLHRFSISGNVLFSSEAQKPIGELCPSLESLELTSSSLKFNAANFLSALPPTLTTLKAPTNNSTWNWDALPISITKLTIAAKSLSLDEPYRPAYASLQALERLTNLRSLHMHVKDGHSHHSEYGPVLSFPHLELLHWEEAGNSEETTFPTTFMQTPLLHSIALTKSFGSFEWQSTDLPPTITHITLASPSGNMFGRTEMKIIENSMTLLPPTLKSLYLSDTIKFDSSTWFEQLPPALNSLIIPPSLIDWAHLPVGLERLICHSVGFDDPFAWKVPTIEVSVDNESASMLPTGTLPPSLTELYLHPSLLHPSQMDILPTKIRKLTLTNGWTLSQAKTLLEKRPSLEMLRFLSPLVLPSPPDDCTTFNIVSYSDDLLRSTLTRDEFARLNVLWRLPSSLGAFKFPPTLTDLMLNSSHGSRTSSIKEDEILAALSSNLPHLSALKNLFVNAARQGRQVPISISKEIEQMRSLEVLKITLVVTTFRFDLLPRTLRELYLLMRNPQQRGLLASTPLDLSNPDVVPDHDPSLLPPSLTSAYIYGVTYSASLALKFHQSIQELGFTASPGWTDVDVFQMSLRMNQAKKLSIRGSVVISGALDSEIAKAAKDATSNSAQDFVSASTASLKERVARLLKPATSFTLQFGTSSFDSLPESLTKLELMDLEAHPSADPAWKILPASWPPNLNYLALDVGFTRVELDKEILYLSIHLRDAEKATQVLALPSRLVTLIAVVSTVPLGNGQFEALPRTLKHLWIAPTNGKDPFLCPSSHVLSTLPRGLEALHLPFFSFEPTDTPSLPPNLQRIRFRGGEHWSDSNLSHLAQICSASYETSPSTVFTDPSLLIFFTKERTKPDSDLPDVHPAPGWSALRTSNNLSGPIFAVATFVSFTGADLPASKVLTAKNMLESASRSLFQNGAYTSHWSTFLVDYHFPAPEDIVSIDLYLAGVRQGASRRPSEFFSEISQIPQLPTMRSLKCLSIFLSRTIELRRLFRLLPQSLEHLSIVSELNQECLEADWASLPRGLKSLSILSPAGSSLPPTRLVGIPPNLEALQLCYTIAATALAYLPGTLKYLRGPLATPGFLTTAWASRGLGEIPDTAPLDAVLYTTTDSLPWWPKF